MSPPLSLSYLNPLTSHKRKEKKEKRQTKRLLDPIALPRLVVCEKISHPVDKPATFPDRTTQMGLSNHVSPSDGILILLVANTALSVSLLRDLLLSFLCLFTSRLTLGSPHPDAIAAAASASDLSFRDRFFDRFHPVRFASASASASRGSDCCVCLNRFEPESVVSWLNCGHLLHKGCLETWMDYQHATCPLCRAHLLPGGEN